MLAAGFGHLYILFVNLDTRIEIFVVLSFNRFNRGIYG